MLGVPIRCLLGLVLNVVCLAFIGFFSQAFSRSSHFSWVAQTLLPLSLSLGERNRNELRCKEFIVEQQLTVSCAIKVVNNSSSHLALVPYPYPILRARIQLVIERSSWLCPVPDST